MLLDEEKESIPFDWSELIICAICAIIVVALYAADKYFQEKVTQQQIIEHKQKQVQQPKFTEM